MIPFSRWCLDRLSRVLEPDERAVVLGDFEELRVSGPRAVGELLGLITRRQVMLWRDWRPWVVLAIVTLPFGLLLSLAARRMADANAIYIWQYVHNWVWSILDTPGPRRDLIEYTTNGLLQAVWLTCWSWTLGLVLGRLSWRTRWVHGALLCVLLLAGGAFFALLLEELRGVSFTVFMALRSVRDNPGNGEVFSLEFFRVVFPLLVHVAFVLLPAFIGLRHGGLLRTYEQRKGPVRTLVAFGALATLATLAITVWSRPPMWLILTAPMTYLLLAVWARSEEAHERRTC